MKVLFVFLMLMVFAFSVQAADFSAKLNIKTGDSQLDLHLSNVNSKASTPAGAAMVRTELKGSYKVSDRELSFLSKKGYTLAEIQYLALIAKQSGKPINDVAALHSKGIGWGVLAKRLGVRPDALRKQIVAAKKIEKSTTRKSVMPLQTEKTIIIKQEQKTTVREMTKEKGMIQEKTQPPRMEGGGMGKGKGR